MRFAKEAAEFTMAEVERLTGFHPETLRTWRRRKYLAQQERYSKVGLYELASLMVRKQLLNHGFGPGDSRPIAERYAASVIYIAVADTPGSCEVHGTAAALQAFENEFGMDENLPKDLAGAPAQTVMILVSIDGDELKPDAELVVDSDSLAGYFVNLEGLGRQLGAHAGKPLFKIVLETPVGDTSRTLVRRIPSMPRRASGSRKR